jgi:hypothetical protein
MHENYAHFAICSFYLFQDFNYLYVSVHCAWKLVSSVVPLNPLLRLGRIYHYARTWVA